MNQFVPDSNMEDDPGSFGDLLLTTNQRKLMGYDDELMELLWQNGNVVMQSQTHRKSPVAVNKFKQAQKPELALNCGGSLGNSSTLIQIDETASLFQYPLDDSLDKELYSELLGEMPPADAICTDKISNDVWAMGERCEPTTVSESNNLLGSAPKQSGHPFQEKFMPPPKLHVVSSIQQAPSTETAGVVNFSNFSTPMKADLESINERLSKKGTGSKIQVGVEESSSMMTLGSSTCASNQVQNLANANHTLNSDSAGVVARGPMDDAQMRLPSEGVQTNTYEGTVTSSSGGSGSSLGTRGLQSMKNQSHKRKGRDAEESECQSEEAEYESIEANKPAQQSKPTGRSRAAEVHNLSERRRRDRINEKMKALQELIPHCNKTDKASMLDEAIEYLKSLQLQVQMMWMGSGMSPMTFPDFQQYMLCMGMGMGHASMAPVHNTFHSPRVPIGNQSVASASTMHQIPSCPPASNPVDFPNQMQNAHVPEAYARYLRVHHMLPPSQVMNFYTYGSHMMQQNQTATALSSSVLPTAGGAPSENIQNNKSV